MILKLKYGKKILLPSRISHLTLGQLWQHNKLDSEISNLIDNVSSDIIVN